MESELTRDEHIEYAIKDLRLKYNRQKNNHKEQADKYDKEIKKIEKDIERLLLVINRDNKDIINEEIKKYEQTLISYNRWKMDELKKYEENKKIFDSIN